MTDERMFISATRYGAGFDAVVLVDWAHVMTFALEENPSERGRLYTVITLDTGHKVLVQETPTEIVQSLAQPKDVGA